MARKKSKHKKQQTVREYTLRYGKKTIRFIWDEVLIFRLMQRLGNRLWGVAGIIIMCTGFAVCVAIRPDMRSWSVAFSDFGGDVRTAPYLAASLFFGAYGLWRWRSYVKRTHKRARPVTTLMSLTVLGLYIAALMPIAWEPWPRRIHILGVIIAGASMAATVVFDTLLTKVKNGRFIVWWQLLRFTSFLLIVVGGITTFGSLTTVGWFNVALLGELLMLLGYGTWIVDKTYSGEGKRSQLSRILHRIVLVD